MPPFTPLNSDTAPNPPLKKGDLRKQFGVSGTFDVGGFIRNEEYNRNLVGRRGLENYDIMSRSDGTVHAGLQVCKLPILAANWMFKSPSDDAADQERTDFLNREFFDRNVDFYDVMSEGLTCLDFGYALGEINYEPTTFNGKSFMWGLQSLASRKQSSVMRWETSTGLLGITQLAPYTDIPMRDIPMQKLYVFTNEKRGQNYEGISLLRFAYKHWYIKDKLELMNAVALERMGLGIPYIKPSENSQITMDGDDVRTVEQALRQIRVNEEAYLKIPQGLEVGMLEFDAREVKDILPTLEYEDNQILLSVLAQFLGLGQGGKGGSRALSDDHSKLFLLSLQAVSRTMQRGFQSVANRLIDLNYSGDLPNGYPKLEFEDLDDDNVTEVATALQQLVDGGVITPGMDVENRGRRLLDLQELTQKDWDQIQADKQLKAQQAAQQAQALAEKQASLQPGVQQPQAPKPVPEQTLTDPEAQPKPDPKAKKQQKEDKLVAADKAVDELFSALAEELAEV